MMFLDLGLILFSGIQGPEGFLLSPENKQNLNSSTQLAFKELQIILDLYFYCDFFPARGSSLPNSLSTWLSKKPLANLGIEGFLRLWNDEDPSGLSDW